MNYPKTVNECISGAPEDIREKYKTGTATLQLPQDEKRSVPLIKKNY